MMKNAAKGIPNLTTSKHIRRLKISVFGAGYKVPINSITTAMLMAICIFLNERGKRNTVSSNSGPSKQMYISPKA